MPQTEVFPPKTQLGAPQNRNPAEFGQKEGRNKKLWKFQGHPVVSVPWSGMARDGGWFLKQPPEFAGEFAPRYGGGWDDLAP